MEEQKTTMDAVMAGCLAGLELGEPQVFENLTVIPLFSADGRSPSYLTLKEALEKNLLTVQELSEGGSVPQLKAVNRAEIPVLILAGEELAGAKQNRVLNTTILLKKRSETVIPVSCTEQGRWAYVSSHFHDSDVVMAPRLRSSHLAAVGESLKFSREFASDQGKVWEGIKDFSEKAKVRSTTCALRDVYESKTGDLGKYLGAFPFLPCQKGLIAVQNGRAMGLDYVSLGSAYAVLHPKLVKSYALDAILQEKSGGNGTGAEEAKSFLQGLAKSKAKRYKSVGHGWDHRYEGAGTVGSALIHQKQVVHAVFFRSEGEGQEHDPRMAGFRRRIDYLTKDR